MYRFMLMPIVSFFALCLPAQSDAQLPDFPIRNIDTVTAKKIGSKYQTTTPHLPVHDMTRDGRLGVLRAGGNRFFILKPKRIVSHLKDQRNQLVGANVLRDGDRSYSFNPNYYRSNGHSHLLRDYANSRSIICEKTQRYGHNPRACSGGNRDCYKVTLVTRFNHRTQDKVRFMAVDANFEVANPKTNAAYIARVTFDRSTIKRGPEWRVPKLAEPTIAGDNRLIVARVHNAELRLHNGTRVPSANLAYNTYPATNSDGSATEQCDVSRWSMANWRPIAYAPFDTVNRMARRYKFARFKFRDTLGNPIPKNGVLGGSYPWIDKGAANLFFEAYGRGAAFYNFRGDGVMRHTPYADHSDHKPRNRDDALNYESIGARTNGISMIGFWTRGKMIHFDGLLNNVDFNFTVSDRIIGRSRKRATRKLKLYSNGTVPSGQWAERVGANRELGDTVLHNEYHQYLTPNSSFLGSWENRFNYLDKAKPVTMRDVVWHFGSTRHTDEIAFDDYMNPYMIINAEMTGAVGYEPTKVTMKHYDGFNNNGQPSINRGLASFPSAPSNDPVLIQNSAAAEPQFVKLPKYGRPIGNIRLEPIAKGGIHGKGLWLDGRSGLQFKIPSQSGTTFSIHNQREWYLSVFIDARRPTSGTQHRQNLIELSNGRKIVLDKRINASRTPNVNVDTVLLVDSTGANIGRATIPGSLLRKRHRKWMNLGIEFTANHRPALFIDGMKVTPFIRQGAYTDAQLKNFFRLTAGRLVTLGTEHASTRGFKGWVDDFKLVARNPTLEEKCNYARGTIIRAPSSGGWRSRANLATSWYHDTLRALSASPSGSHFTCYVRYGEAQMANLTPIETFAHRKNIPYGAVSVRDKLIHRRQVLRYGRPRPNFSGNKFCLSCHTPQLSYTKPELDVRALQLRPGVNEEDDPRRQPMQPARIIRGVIPAHYFGTNKPRTKLTGSYKIDQFLLDR
ncbi:MAG: hypothetical protein HRT45_01775 [Bdellovibrionales bacterium]|nr:hypothetical protein [Bdellovibrionales bacterium]